MELVHVRQVPFEDLSQERIDVLMFACSGTMDVNAILPTFLIPARRKIILAFCNDPISNSAFPNDAEIIYFRHDDDISEIHQALENLCQTYKSDNIKLVIDYTFMQKRVLGAIVSFLSINEFTCNRLTVYFYCAETPVNFQQSSETVLQPILLYENYKFNKRPIALIVELNSMSQIEHVKELYYTFCPVLAHFFIPSPILNQKGIESLEKFPTSKVVGYIPHDLELLDETLRQLCRQLRLDHRVVVVTMGSKIFSMVAFLINARYPDVEVWQYDVATFTENWVEGKGEKFVYRAILSDDFFEDIT